MRVDGFGEELRNNHIMTRGEDKTIVYITRNVMGFGISPAVKICPVYIPKQMPQSVMLA